MSSTAQILERVRPRLELLVEAERIQIGSKMLAYARIAHALGRSSSWLQNVLGRQGRVGLAAETAERIALLYGRICERIEASAEDLHARAAALRETGNAGWSRTAQMDRRSLGLDQGDGKDDLGDRDQAYVARKSSGKPEATGAHDPSSLFASDLVTQAPAPLEEGA